MSPRMSRSKVWEGNPSFYPSTPGDSSPQWAEVRGGKHLLLSLYARGFQPPMGRSKGGKPLLLSLYARGFQPPMGRSKGGETPPSIPLRPEIPAPNGQK